VKRKTKASPDRQMVILGDQLDPAPPRSLLSVRPQQVHAWHLERLGAMTVAGIRQQGDDFRNAL